MWPTRWNWILPSQKGFAMKRSSPNRYRSQLATELTLAGVATFFMVSSALAGPPQAPGCPSTTTEFKNMGIQEISAGAPSIVTSIMPVTGADPFLWDLDVTTFIKHSNCEDLDVTITSPAGTVVTLTSDNGGGSDNCYYGTRWDDSANPGGPAPYSDNDGVVSDTTFLDGVAGSPLTPEEALGAFRGENPNGDWTLRISDDKHADGGELSGWKLHVTTIPNPPAETVFNYANDIPAHIADNETVTSQIEVGALERRLGRLRLKTNIQHTFAGDLVVSLTSPSGTVVTLTSESGESSANVFNGTEWDDDANPAGQVPYDFNDGLVTDHQYVSDVLASPLAPEEPLSAFVGENPNGKWTLTIGDTAGGDTGDLNGWTLEITTAYEPGADSDNDGIPNSCDSIGGCGVGFPALFPFAVVGLGLMRASFSRFRR